MKSYLLHRTEEQQQIYYGTVLSNEWNFVHNQLLVAGGGIHGYIVMQMEVWISRYQPGAKLAISAGDVFKGPQPKIESDMTYYIEPQCEE